MRWTQPLGSVADAAGNENFEICTKCVPNVYQIGVQFGLDPFHHPASDPLGSETSSMSENDARDISDDDVGGKNEQVSLESVSDESIDGSHSSTGSGSDSGVNSASSSASNVACKKKKMKMASGDEESLLERIDEAIWISVIGDFLSSYDIVCRLSYVSKSMVELARKLPIRVDIPMNHQQRGGRRFDYNLSSSRYRNVCAIRFLGGNHDGIRTGISNVETPRICGMMNFLQELDVQFTDILDQDMRQIADCNSMLKKLVLQGCFRITDLAPISRFKNLEYLDVAFTQIPDVAPLLRGGPSSLPELRKLNIGYCQRIESLSHLTSKTLDTLWMGNCTSIQSFDISGLKNLRVLEMTACSFPFSVAKCLPRRCLEILEISNNDHINSYDLSVLPQTLKVLAIGASCPRITDLTELNATNVTTLYLTGPRTIDITSKSFPNKITELHLENVAYSFDGSIRLRKLDTIDCTGTVIFPD